MFKNLFLLPILVIISVISTNAHAAYVLPYPSDFGAQHYWLSTGTGINTVSLSQSTVYADVSIILLDHLHLAYSPGMYFSGLSQIPNLNFVPVHSVSAGLFQFIDNFGVYAGANIERKAFGSGTFNYANQSYHGYLLYKIPIAKKYDVHVSSSGKVRLYSPSYFLVYSGVRQIRFDSYAFATGATAINQVVLGTHMFGGDLWMDRASFFSEVAVELPVGQQSGERLFNVSLGIAIPLFGSDDEELKAGAFKN